MLSVKEAASSAEPFLGDVFQHGACHDVARLLSDHHMFDEIGRALEDYPDDAQPFSVCPSPRTESPWPFNPAAPSLTSMSSSSTILSLAEQQLQKRKRKAAAASKRKRMLIAISSTTTTTTETGSSTNNDSDDTGSFPPSSSSMSTEYDEAGNTDNVVPSRKRSKSSSKEDANARQQRSRKSSSTYRGVSLCTKDSRWQARIRIKKEVVYLGRFETEEEAARRYDEAAREHHGDKALINFISTEDRALGRKSVFEQAGGKSVRM